MLGSIVEIGYIYILTSAMDWMRILAFARAGYRLRSLLLDRYRRATVMDLIPLDRCVFPEVLWGLSWQSSHRYMCLEHSALPHYVLRHCSTISVRPFMGCRVASIAIGSLRKHPNWCKGLNHQAFMIKSMSNQVDKILAARSLLLTVATRARHV